MGTVPQESGATDHPAQYELFEQLGLEPEKYLVASHGPVVVQTAEQFLHATCLESHINEVIVLPQGLDKLDLTSSLPAYVLQLARESDSVLQFCDRLDAEKGLHHFDAYLSRFPEGEETLLSRDKHGDRFEDLYEMCREAKKEYPTDKYYISELGRYDKRDHPLTKERTRCLLDAEVRDRAEQQLGLRLPIWERGNAFVGEAGTGSCVHVDKVMWSNTGKNWSGYKLFCMWPLGKESDAILDKHYKKIMSPPFSDLDLEALRSAVKVCLLVPGDVYVFCGACAHMAVSVGPELNISGYEALVNFHRDSLRVFCTSGTEGHLEAEQASTSAMYEWKEDAVQRVIDAAQDVHEGRLTKQQLQDAVEEICLDKECCALFDEFSGHAKKKPRASTQEDPPGQTHVENPQ